VARTVGGVMVLCLLVASVGRGDEGGGWRDRVTLIASERLRGELVEWFRPRPGAADPGANRYGFVASQLRAGLSVTLPHAQLTLVAQDTRLGNLPDDASLPPPVGNLGPGAIYFANTKQRTQGEPFLKLGFVTLRRAGLTATVGRYEYRDGLEHQALHEDSGGCRPIQIHSGGVVVFRKEKHHENVQEHHGNQERSHEGERREALHRGRGSRARHARDRCRRPASQPCRHVVGPSGEQVLRLRVRTVMRDRTKGVLA